MVEPLLLQNQLPLAGLARLLSFSSSLMASVVRFSGVSWWPSAPSPSLSWAGTVTNPFQRSFGSLKLTNFIFCLFLLLPFPASSYWWFSSLTPLGSPKSAGVVPESSFSSDVTVFYVPVWKGLKLTNFIFQFSDWERYEM